MLLRRTDVESSWKPVADAAVGSVGGRRVGIDKETHQIESERGYRESSLAQPNVTVHRKKNSSCLCLFDSFTGEETAGSDSRCLCPTESFVWLSGWIGERVWIVVFYHRLALLWKAPELSWGCFLRFCACMPKPLLFTFASAKLTCKL